MKRPFDPPPINESSIVSLNQTTSPSLAVPSEPFTTPAKQQVLWTVWLTYGAFYFCRTNLSSAVPGMEASLAHGGLGLTGDETGAILASLKLTYGIGQLLNGQLSEHFSPRKLLALGMLTSAGLNVLFGLSTGFYFLLFVWACNGYFQSFGWTPCIRVLSNWFPVLQRGKAIGIVGTGYQITLGLTYLVASQSAQHLGWRYALYVPAAILAASALFMLAGLRESPAAETEVREGAQPDKTPDGGRGHWTENVLLTLSNPLLWLLGLTLGLLNACRYGFVDWGISHLVTVQKAAVGKAGLTYVIFAVGAIAGSYLAGWATDRYSGGRRAPVICILLFLLGVLTLVYEYLARTSPLATMGVLALIGFCVIGPQVLLVGTAPADLARKGTTAAAAGFVNFVGYMGAALGDTVTGHFKQEAHGGWQVAIYIWAGWAFVAAAISAILWNATANPPQSENPQE